MMAEGQLAVPEGYVLVVDDDEDIRLTLQQILEEEGFQVRSAANGQEALELLLASRESPRLILLDLMMPVMDGSRFRSRQIAEPRIADVPVIIISAGGGLSQKANVLRAAGYLAKPIDLRTLIGTVQRWVGAR